MSSPDPVRPHYVNGRVLLRNRGGVFRYASEISSRLTGATVEKPRSAKYPWSGRVWEQTQLLRATRDGVLLNMAHAAPVRHMRQVSVVHDLLALTDPRGVHPAYAALLRRQLPRYVASARRVVAVSSHVADKVARVFDVASTSIDVVPPGVSDVFRPRERGIARRQLGLDTDRPVIAALLDLTPRKNSPLVAELLRELQADHPNLQVVVAGGSQRPSFAKGRRREPVSRQGFVNLGAATDAQLATMYQAATIFVSLSSAEGFGLPAVEAMACGAAVVSTPTPSLTEYTCGALLVDGAPAARRVITELLHEPARQREMSIAAHEGVHDLQWATSAASLGAIMDHVGST